MITFIIFFFAVLLLFGFTQVKYRAISFKIFRMSLLAFVCFTFVLPFLWMIAGAFKDKSVLNQYLFFPPLSKWSWQTINFNNFAELFQPQTALHGQVFFWQHLINSVFISCSSTILQLITSSLAGYALAVYRFKAQNILLGFMMGTLMIPPMILLSPLYEVIYSFHWMDSYYALIIPTAVNVFGILLFRQSILGLPKEIIEAGRLDGCSEMRIFYKLIIPLVRPVSATFCLIAFLSSWGAFIAPNVFIHSQEKLPLTVILNMYVGQYSEQYGVFLAGTLLAILPPAILFMILQKEFVRGITTGAIKG